MELCSSAREIINLIFVANHRRFARRSQSKPVWNWILRDVHTDKLMPVGFADTGKDAAKNICIALRNQAELDARK